MISTSFNDYRDDIGNAAKLIVSLLDNERTESISQVENLVVAHRPSSEDTVEIAKNVAELEVEFGVLRAKINERITPVIAFLNSLSFDINDNELV